MFQVVVKIDLMRLTTLVLSILLAAATFATFVVTDGPSAIVVRGTLAAIVIMQGITAYLAIKSASKAATEARLEINDVLAPLAVALKGISLASTALRRREVVSFLTAAVAVCIQLSEGSKLRATFFEVVDRSGHRVFVPSSLSVGRGDPAVSEFVEGDGGEGDVVWEAARRGEPRLESDIKRFPPRHMDTKRTRMYRSFITMPVVVNGKPAGLLTINSPQRKGLSEEDIVPMRVVADLCAAAIAANGGKCPPLSA